MKNLALITNKNTIIEHSVKTYFDNKKIKLCIQNDIKNIPTNEGFDLIALVNYSPSDAIKNLAMNNKIINLHQSILPAFQEEEPLYKAFQHGVKVTGVTVHNVLSDNFYGPILTQYPVLIGLSTHFDTLQNEINNISSKLYPLVIDSILHDRVFDYPELLKNSSCSNCSKHCNK